MYICKYASSGPISLIARLHGTTAGVKLRFRKRSRLSIFGRNRYRSRSDVLTSACYVNPGLENEVEVSCTQPIRVPVSVPVKYQYPYEYM
jgi:hypothetical protein